MDGIGVVQRLCCLLPRGCLAVRGGAKPQGPLPLCIRQHPKNSFLSRNPAAPGPPAIPSVSPHRRALTPGACLKVSCHGNSGIQSHKPLSVGKASPDTQPPCSSSSSHLLWVQSRLISPDKFEDATSSCLCPLHFFQSSLDVSNFWSLGPSHSSVLGSLCVFLKCRAQIRAQGSHQSSPLCILLVWVSYTRAPTSPSTC